MLQVVTACEYMHGTLRHAVALTCALAGLGDRVRLVSVRPSVLPPVRKKVEAAGAEVVAASPRGIPEADLSLFVGLWDRDCAEAARRLACRRGRLILVPTVYWQENLLPDFPSRAEALWYVSWDQAAAARPYWHLAERVEVVRCAVDVGHFTPSERNRTKSSWVLCRHSRDAPEKFAPGVTEILWRLGEFYDVTFQMLGATGRVLALTDPRIRIWPLGAMDPAEFLSSGDLWVYEHSPSWRESACIAMLEAMACGLPVLVTGAGGMREYLPHGLAGFACRNRDEFVLYARLLMDRPDLYRAFADEAREYVCRNHSYSSLGRTLRSLLF